MGNLLLSDTNHVESSILNAIPASVTNLDFLKNSFGARRAKWTNLENVIVITVNPGGLVSASFFAIPGHNLRPDATVRLVLLNGGEIIYSSGNVLVGESEVFALFFDQEYTYDFARVIVDHGYTYTPPVENETETQPVVTTTTVPDGIYRQGSDGTLSLELENGEFSDAGADNFLINDENGASNGRFISKSETTFYGNSNDGPRSTFEFTASRSGATDVWLRVRSSSNKNSMYVIFDGSSKATIMPTSYSVWTWHKARTVTLTVEQRHNVAIAARDNLIEIDKMVLLPAGSPVPNGVGPAESGEGTRTTTTVVDGETITTIEAGSSDSVELRMLLLGTTIELNHNFSQGATISFLTDPEIETTHSGRSVIARPQRRTRRLSLTLPQMLDTDTQKVIDHEINLSGKPCLVNAYSDREAWKRDSHIFLARFEGAGNYSQQTNTINSTSRVLVEV